MNDIPVNDLARLLSYLEPEPPLTKELDKWGIKQYPSQKIHMYIWTRNQPNTGKGAYSRKEGNTSGAVMYNRFLNPGGLLWLAEVLGETEAALREAVSAAIKAERVDYRRRCVAFRQVIPWDRIMILLSQPQGWRYDPKMLPLIEQDPEGGLPKLKEGRTYRSRYIKALDAEEGDRQTAMNEAAIRAAGISPPEPRKKEKLSKAERRARGWEF